MDGKQLSFEKAVHVVASFGILLGSAERNRHPQVVVESYESCAISSAS
jgi:hypothetical protein